jgi:hypothetical protein
MAGMKTKTDKRARREHRKAKQRRQRDERMSLHGFGGSMDPLDLAQLDRTLETFDPGSWSAVSRLVLPVLKRTWHPYPSELEPFRIEVPPGIPTGFGIDLGPAFSHVTPDLLSIWGIDPATLLGTALENLRALVRREPPRLGRFVHEGVDIQSIQGQGWGSALVLLPEVLRPIVGPEPRVLLAPVRNTLLTLPETVAPEVAVDVWEAMTAGAHDAIDMEPLRWTGSTVVALTDVATRGLPN